MEGMNFRKRLESQGSQGSQGREPHRRRGNSRVHCCWPRKAPPTSHLALHGLRDVMS